MKATTLIIEDDLEYAHVLERQMQLEGFATRVVHSGEAGLAVLGEVQPELVLVDIGLPGIDGIEVIRRISEVEPGTVCMIVSGQTDLEVVVSAMRQGAADYITKTSDVAEISFRLHRALEVFNLRQQVLYLGNRHGAAGEIVGESPAMRVVMKQIAQIAASPSSTVLISGETGTGKELVARAIHQQSSRRVGPLVTVNCAAVTETLMESEFFGHERGAFTGANKLRRGPFEMANRGSLFLDEIGELDQRLQAKLLRALEEKRVRRVGGEQEIDVDVRLIAATNRDLERLVTERSFREDLLYRVNVFEIRLPPLRQRGEDILLLASRFIADLNRQLDKRIVGLDRRCEQAMMAYPFPGNVRQLRNFVEQAMIVAPGETLTRDLFPGLGVGGAPGTEISAPISTPDLDTLPLSELMGLVQNRETELLELEHVIIGRALDRARGNKTRASELLGISRYALRRRMRRNELTTEERDG